MGSFFIVKIIIKTNYWLWFYSIINIEQEGAEVDD